MYFEINFKVVMQDEDIYVLCKLIIFHILTPGTKHMNLHVPTPLVFTYKL
jgi:hypothetical protein